MPVTDVAVIGGGISGLAVAYELCQRNVACFVFEQASRVGGVIRTDRIGGFTIDGGPDSLLVQKPAAIQLCTELGLGDRLIPTLPPRTAYVMKNGELLPLPEASVLGIPTRLRSLATTRLLSPAGKIRMAQELTIPRSTWTTDESVGSFFRRRFGAQAVDYIAEPLLAGIHGGDVERLSMLALFPRLAETERQHGSIIGHYRSLRAETDRSRDGLFRSLPGGIGELTDAIRATLPAECVLTNHDVASVQGRSPYTVTSTSGTATTTTTARSVVFATPAYVTARLVSTVAPELEQLCGTIPYTSTATVVLSYPAKAVRHVPPGTGFVVPRVESGPSLMAGSWVSSKWPGRAPTGDVLLRGFLGGARDRRVLEQSDSALVDAAHRDFAELLGISAEPGVRQVYRWPRRNPQLEVGHLDRLAAIDAELARWSGLHIVGAGFRGVGIPDCIESGRAAAREIASQS